MLHHVTEAGKQWHQHSELVQVTEEYLAKLHEHEPRVQSFVTVAADAARSSAADLDTVLAERGGAALGALTGVPVGIKVAKCPSAHALELSHKPECLSKSLQPPGMQAPAASAGVEHGYACILPRFKTSRKRIP